MKYTTGINLLLYGDALFSEYSVSLWLMGILPPSMGIWQRKTLVWVYLDQTVCLGLLEQKKFLLVFAGNGLYPKDIGLLT